MESPSVSASLPSPSNARARSRSRFTASLIKRATSVSNPISSTHCCSSRVSDTLPSADLHCGNWYGQSLLGYQRLFQCDMTLLLVVALAPENLEQQVGGFSRIDGSRELNRSKVMRN